jgi:CMP-N,N'-diacetyllegionaminic acid synthase
MKFVYLILARKGSVRIKNKNLKKIKKKSLVELTIDFAKKIAKVDKIILSTDSNEIRNIGRKKGLNIDHLRPKRLSKANTSSYASAIYEVKKYEKNNNKIDAVVLLQPTTPFRSVKTYNKLKKIFISDPNKPLISVKKLALESNRIFKKNKNYLTHYDYKKRNLIFIPNGAYFFISKKTLNRNKSFFSKKMNFYEIKNLKENIDIDTKEDLFFAKKIS